MSNLSTEDITQDSSIGMYVPIRCVPTFVFPFNFRVTYGVAPFTTAHYQLTELLDHSRAA